MISQFGNNSASPFNLQNPAFLALGTIVDPGNSEFHKSLKLYMEDVTRNSVAVAGAPELKSRFVKVEESQTTRKPISLQDALAQSKRSGQGTSQRQSQRLLGAAQGPEKEFRWRKVEDLIEVKEEKCGC